MNSWSGLPRDSTLPLPHPCLVHTRFRSRCGAFVNVTSQRGRLLTAFLRISFLFYFVLYSCPSSSLLPPPVECIKRVCLCIALPAACCLFLHHSLPVATDDVTHFATSSEKRGKPFCLFRLSTILSYDDGAGCCSIMPNANWPRPHCKTLTGSRLYPTPTPSSSRQSGPPSGTRKFEHMSHGLLPPHTQCK